MILQIIFFLTDFIAGLRTFQLCLNNYVNKGVFLISLMCFGALRAVPWLCKIT